MMCPACKVALQLSYRSDIEIDYCPQCRGVWLDRGELDKIVDRASLVPIAGTDHESRPRDRHLQSSEDSRAGRRKKKRGWLTELFDFDD